MTTKNKPSAGFERRKSPFPPAYEGDSTVVSSVDFDDAILAALAHEPTNTPPLRSHGQARYELLLAADRDSAEQRVEIAADRFVIGKRGCDLNLDDRFVSPSHAQIVHRDGVLLLQDLGSENGVYLRIADEFALEDGDQIIMGRQRLEFRTSWDTPNTPASSTAVDQLGAPDFESPIRVIRYLEGNRVAQVVPVKTELVIGRRKGDIVCGEDLLLSPEHAEIFKHADDYYLSDLNSDLGTFIRVHDAVELVAGDCFMIGRTRCLLQYAR